MKTSIYRNYAERAAKAEQNKHWQIAYEQWLLAFKASKRTENREWALARAMFCNAQLPSNQRLRFEENP